MACFTCADGSTEEGEEIDEEASDLGDQEVAAAEGLGCQVGGQCHWPPPTLAL